MRMRATAPADVSAAAAEGEARVRPAPLEEEVVALFDRLRQPLLRYLFSFGLPLADGEEIVQEVFLSLFQHLRRGGSRAHLRAWLFRVAHNLALRRRHRTLRETGVEAAGTDVIPDPAPDAEEQLITGETGQRLRSVMQALPQQDRRCLSLRAEGLRYREIGQVLQMSLGAVSLSLTRSLARLARAAER